MIAVLAATYEEIGGFCAEVEPDEAGTFDDLAYVKGRLNDSQILVGVSGVGIRRARKAAGYVVQKFKPSIIVSAGFSGALSPGLKVGDIVVGERVVSEKKGAGIDLYSPECGVDMEFVTGALLTENRFVHDPRDKKSLFERTGAMCVDMETWGVVEGARGSRTQVLCVRVISDDSDDALPAIGAFYDSRGKPEYLKAVSYFFKRPGLLYPYARYKLLNSKRAALSLRVFLLSLTAHLMV